MAEKEKSIIKNELDIKSKKVLINNHKILIFEMDDLARIYDKIEEIEENNQIVEKEPEIWLIMKKEINSICDELNLKAHDLISNNEKLSEKNEDLKIKMCRYKNLLRLHNEIHNYHYFGDLNPIILLMISNI